MATQPLFVSDLRLGIAAVSSANTNRDGTGTIVDIIPGVAAPGSKIERIVAQATGDPADSVLTLFLHNGTSWFLFDEIDLSNPVAASTILPAFRAERKYEEIYLPNASHKIGAAITVAPTAGVVNVFAWVGDLT